jgi:hypothetical protein
MTREFEFFHGLVFSRLIHSLDRKVSIARFPAASNSSYVVDERIGLYIKHCAKRMTPWRFTFRREHQAEIQEMKAKLGAVFVVLVCNDDGLVCLAYDELLRIIDNEHEPVEWVSAARRARQMYAVKGSNGSLECKVGAAVFPQKIFSQPRA